jgi:hypothetical protein
MDNYDDHITILSEIEPIHDYYWEPEDEEIAPQYRDSSEPCISLYDQPIEKIYTDPYGFGKSSIIEKLLKTTGQKSMPLPAIDFSSLYPTTNYYYPPKDDYIENTGLNTKDTGPITSMDLNKYHKSFSADFDGDNYAPYSYTSKWTKYISNNHIYGIEPPKETIKIPLSDDLTTKYKAILKKLSVGTDLILKIKLKHVLNQKVKLEIIDLTIPKPTTITIVHPQKLNNFPTNTIIISSYTQTPKPGRKHKKATKANYNKDFKNIQFYKNKQPKFSVMNREKRHSKKFK